MNAYQQALMSGQFSPGQYMQQNRQSQNFTPMQAPQMAPIPQMGQGQMGQGQGMGGMDSLLDVLKKKQMKPVAEDVAGAVTPNLPGGVAPDKMAGPGAGGSADFLKAIMSGARLFAGG